MAKTTHLSVTALKDTHVVTARRQLQYRKVDGLEGSGMPEGQTEQYENVHGISLQKDATIEIDVRDDQLPMFQAAVDAGDIEVSIHAAPIVPTATVMAPSAPIAAPALMAASKPDNTPVEKPRR
jgi:uncharacterized protein YcsI (UPF0317 family)